MSTWDYVEDKSDNELIAELERLQAAINQPNTLSVKDLGLHHAVVGELEYRGYSVTVGPETEVSVIKGVAVNG